ncbi:MAG: hypothetical protein RLY31_828 [Bacteroidota bacterium]|jgi:hypothetical protein
MKNNFTTDLPTSEATREAVLRGLRFLRERQFPGGGFPTLTAQAVGGSNEEMETFEDGDRKGTVSEDPHSVFPAILIGLSLLHTAGVGHTDDILRRLSGFLLDNMQRHGIWQHFTREHPFHSVTPCDLDLTAMASAFLTAMGVRIPDNRPAILSNKTPDKRLYTWYTFRRPMNLHPANLSECLRALRNPVKSYLFWKHFECERDDTDAVVNANVLSYIGLREETAPVAAWLNDIVIRGLEEDCDKWYRKPSTVYYFFSRNYHLGITALEPMRALLRERVLASFQADGSVENHPLDTALMVCTLLNLRYPEDIPTQAVSFLCARQLPHGSWARRLFYYGGPKRIMGWGSEEMTTACCVEALHRYASVRPPSPYTT